MHLEVVSFLFVGTFAADRNLGNFVERIAFGSCAKQYRDPLNIWESIANFRPQVWLWMGDAGYSECGTLECIQDSYQKLNNSQKYKNFVDVDDDDEGLILDGTWDDHDYGVGDGTGSFHLKRASQQMFLDFLGVPIESTRRTREGVYSSIDFGSGDKSIRVILLDTRFHREDHWVPLVGSWRTPFNPLVGAGLRWLAAWTGFGADFAGDMLGEEQWTWLESELANSPAKVNILVSSIQVFTTFGVVESWGHYPKSRDRLVQTIQRTAPRGFLILSGDVHYGQILGNQSTVVEVTSSGMTHVAVEYPLVGPLILSFWVPRATRDVGAPNVAMPGVPDGSLYAGRNFGTLEFDWGESNVKVTATVRGTMGAPKLQSTQTFRFDEDPKQRLAMLSELPPLIQHRPIYESIFRLLGLTTTVVLVALLVVLGNIRIIRRSMRERRRRPTTRPQQPLAAETKKIK